MKIKKWNLNLNFLDLLKIVNFSKGFILAN